MAGKSLLFIECSTNLDVTTRSANFEMIHHSILLKRLSNSFGVMGSAHNWLNSYLSVPVGSSSSHVISTIYGVPQGSVLGPVLFSIYISPIVHISSLFNVPQQQYADDTQLMLFISPSNIEKSLTYSNVYSLSEAGFFIMALLSTLTKLKLPALEPSTGDSLSAVSPPFKWLMPLSHLVTTSNYSVSHLIVA